MSGRSTFDRPTFGSLNITSFNIPWCIFSSFDIQEVNRRPRVKGPTVLITPGLKICSKGKLTWHYLEPVILKEEGRSDLSTSIMRGNSSSGQIFCILTPTEFTPRRQGSIFWSGKNVSSPPPAKNEILYLGNLAEVKPSKFITGRHFRQVVLYFL